MKANNFIPLLLLLTGSAAGFAQDHTGTCGENLTWELTGTVLTIKGTGMMTDYSSETKSPWYSEYSETILQVIIEDGVENIGTNAFENCSNLESVTIGNGVKSIEMHAFSNCAGLATVEFAEGSKLETIGMRAFSVAGLANINIPASVTSIGDSGFSLCSKLATVVFAEGSMLKTIGEDAFFYCGQLSSINIPSGVTRIERQTFYNCGLASIDIPNGVESIGEDAFFECSFANVIIPESVTRIEKGAFENCENLTSINIPSGVDTIPESVFSSCRNLSSIVIPNSVTHIKDYAFSVSGLSSIAIPNTIESIGEYAFAFCTNLSAINVADDNGNYASADGVLFNKDKTTLIQYPAGKPDANYVIPDGVESIGESSFIFSQYLTSVTIPEGVVNIAEGAFMYCHELTSVSIPESVESIEQMAFVDCINLVSIVNLNPTPQKIEEDEYVFDEVDANKLTVYVPVGSVETYKAADIWKEFNIVALPVTPLTLRKDLEDAIVCIGGSHTFAIEAKGENLSYEWYYGNERITGANGNTCTITNAELRDYERYHVIVRSQVGDYRSSVYSKNVRLWVAGQLPETLRFTEFPSTAITGNTYRIKLAGYSDVTQYIWNYDRDGVAFSPATGGIGDNETLATFGVLSAGQGTLTVTLEHPCGTRQATQPILVSYPTGVEPVAGAAVEIFPNPTTGLVNVTNTHSGQPILVTGVTGSLTRTYQARDGVTTIDLTGYTKGVYLIQYNGKTIKVMKK
jgi:hypothetical protein